MSYIYNYCCDILSDCSKVGGTMLDVRAVFASAVDSIDVDEIFDFSELEFFKNHPFKSPVHVKGNVKRVSGSVVFDAVVEYDYSAPCDRCAADVVKKYNTKISHILVNELSNEDTEEFILIEDMLLDLENLVRTDLILAIPSKFLCKENCKGLCTSCGKDLNEGDCDCGNEDIDPRFAALKTLLK